MAEIPPYDEKIEFKDKIPLLTNINEYDDEFDKHPAYVLGREVLEILSRTDFGTDEHNNAVAKRDKLNEEIKEANKKTYETMRAQGYDIAVYSAEQMMLLAAQITPVQKTSTVPKLVPLTTGKQGRAPTSKPIQVKWGVSRYEQDVENFRENEGIEKYDGIQEQKKQSVDLPGQEYDEDVPDPEDVKQLLYLFELFNGQDTYSHERVTIGPLRKKEYLVIPPDYTVPRIGPEHVLTQNARDQLEMRHFFQIAYLNSKVFADELTDANKDIAAGFVFFFFLLRQNNVSVAAITETWNLTEVTGRLTGYALYLRTRQALGDQRLGGGVALYVREDIPMKELRELESTEHEAVWVRCKPSAMPRAYSCIIFASIYYPESAKNRRDLVTYLQKTVDHLRAFYGNPAIVLAGDFNQTKKSWLASCLSLKQVVNFPTHESGSILDLILTNCET